MNLVSKWFLGKLGRLRAIPLEERSEQALVLPPPQKSGGTPLLDALAERRSQREFEARPLALQQLSTLLWAADGINRPREHEHTAPSAMNAQEIDVYVALSGGLFRYEAEQHSLELIAAVDARRTTGLQTFVDVAPLDLVYVADFQRMLTIPESRRGIYAAACAGAIAQNVYLYCASEGLATVVRGLFDAKVLGEALTLSSHQHVMLTQTVGYPKG